MKNIQRLIIVGTYGRKKFYHEVDNPTKRVIVAWKHYCKKFLDKYNIKLETYKRSNTITILNG